jgi:hypothetical protein
MRLSEIRLLRLDLWVGCMAAGFVGPRISGIFADGWYG